MSTPGHPHQAQPHQGGRDPSLYRPNVGIAIFSRKGHVWLGRRTGARKDDTRYAWQMPQGGIDRGETPSEAALRELGEETGRIVQAISPTECSNYIIGAGYASSKT